VTDEPGGPADAPLTAAGRRSRSAAAVLLVGALTASALIGVDDWFPLAPFRMYATANSPNGEIAVVGLEVREPGGEWRRAPLRPSTVGLSVAEVEGQLPRLVDDPGLIGHLAAAHARLDPQAPPWEGVRLLRLAQPLRDGAPVGERTREVLAEWTAP
jgi:hypothetical protein